MTNITAKMAMVIFAIVFFMIVPLRKDSDYALFVCFQGVYTSLNIRTIDCCYYE